MIITDTKERDWYLLGSELPVKSMVSDIQVDVLDSVTKQSTAKNWPSVISMECEKPPPVTSVDSESGFESSNQDVNGWLSLIRDGLYSIPSVEDIFISIEGSDVDVWVVIPERDLAILHQITEKEIDLFKTLVSGESPPFLIDSHIIYRCGRNLEDLAPTRAFRLPRQV